MPTTGFLSAHFDTSATLVNQVAQEVGLKADPAPFSSSNQLITFLVGLLNVVGRDLIKRRSWQMLQRTFTFVTNAAAFPTGFYPLPDDYGSMIDQTQWDRTNRQPAWGPASPQITEWIIGTGTNNLGLWLGFRLQNGDFLVQPAPAPDGRTVAFEYNSNLWVQLTGTTDYSGRRNQTTLPSDLILFDPLLFSRALKLRFLTEKGFDNTAAESEFNQLLGTVGGQDQSAPILSLNGPTMLDVPMIGPANLPPGGNWGR